MTYRYEGPTKANLVHQNTRRLVPLTVMQGRQVVNSDDQGGLLAPSWQSEAVLFRCPT